MYTLNFGLVGLGNITETFAKVFNCTCLNFIHIDCIPTGHIIKPC